MPRFPHAALAVTALGFGLSAASHARAQTVPVAREDHMEMTVRTLPQADDAARGDAILAAARAAVARYPRAEDAERDGYVKFLPGVALPTEHYTSRKYALAAALGTFDLVHPTSIIYKRSPAGLDVAGVMYTAPNRFNAAQLDARVPLSLGTWHRHIDFCWPPGDRKGDARFGFAGSIRTKDACAAAGGTFTPLVFGWMVHVWPLESEPAKIWAVDAGGGMMHGMMHGH